MKKSFSAPNLTSPGVQLMPTPPRRKSVSTQALYSLADAISQEWQIESVFKVSAAQAGTCGISARTFPYEILSNPDSYDDDKVKDMALCLATPPEKEEPVIQKIFTKLRNASYLEQCEMNANLSRRYAILLQSVRKNRRNTPTSCDTPLVT